MVMTRKKAMRYRMSQTHPESNEKKFKDPVIVICYNEREHWERAKAIKFYTEGMLACEGCERERYAAIVYQLSRGRKIATDLE